MSNEEPDTSWFDLKKYDRLSELDLIGWHRQLDLRRIILFCGLSKEQSNPLIIQIKEQPIIASYSNGMDSDESDHLYPFNTFSVKSMTTLYLTSECIDTVWRPLFTQQKLTNPPQSFLFHLHNGINDDRHLTNVTINLQATNEQIISDFKHWLTGYRKFTNIESKKKNFTDKELSEWVEYRLLPYIDLTLVAKFEGKKIPKAEIARLLFEHDYKILNINDRLTNVTIPRANLLVKQETYWAISAQINAGS